MDIQQLLKDRLLIPVDDGKFQIHFELSSQLVGDGVILSWYRSAVDHKVSYEMKEMEARVKSRSDKKSYYSSQLDDYREKAHKNKWLSSYEDSHGNIEKYLALLLCRVHFTMPDIEYIIKKGNHIPLFMLEDDGFRLFAIMEIIESLEMKLANDLSGLPDTGIPIGDIKAHFKIKWKGTQRDLGELFMRLYECGWIEKIRSETIKKAFTNSDTIEQILKPSAWEDQILTGEQKFENILKNLFS